MKKELLSEVLGYPFNSITKLTQSTDGKYIAWSTYEDPRPHDWKQLTIYELMHLMKKKAKEKNFLVGSGTTVSDSQPYWSDVSWVDEDEDMNRASFWADTEPEAVEKAYEYVMRFDEG